MSTDLFNARVLVAIADRAAKLTGISALSDPELANLTEFALEIAGYRDIDSDAVRAISRASSDRSALYDAFWRVYGKSFPSIPPTCSRLWINPPAGIQVNRSIVDHTWCRERDIKNLVDPIGTSFYGDFEYSDLIASSFANIDGSAGFYDSIVVFPGKKPDGFIPVKNHVLPGTEITVVRPSPAHRYWTSWTEFDTDKSWLFEPIEEDYAIRMISDVSKDDVEIIVLGVESK